MHCKHDLWYLARVVLQYSWLDEDLHGRELCGFLTKNKEKDTATFLPRGHGKTLLAGACRVIQYILNDPNVSIMYASATEDLALDFGAMIAKELMHNDMLQEAFSDILPSRKDQLKAWGNDGYSLPNRRPRIDPTLFTASLKSNVTGKHPDIVFLDDLVVRVNNNELGWSQAESFIKECKMLLPAQGVMHILGTRWHDSDPYGKIFAGQIKGKRGTFVLSPSRIRSCYVDDNPANQPTYPAKVRWNMDKLTGYTKEQLDDMRKPEHEGGLGEYFDAQMRNDPAPEERQDIKVGDINLYEPGDEPAVSHVRAFGIETTGGGAILYNLLDEKAEKLQMSIPTSRIEHKRVVGQTKIDRIKATLEPLVRGGKIWAQKKWIGDKTATEGLGYEIRRLGKAKHDDIIDALHSVPAHLSRGSVPDEDQPADLYLMADLAWSEKQSSDFSVCVAVAVDHKGNYWILDIDRFKISAPSGIIDRLIEFYCKWEAEDTASSLTGSNFNFAKTYR